MAGSGNNKLSHDDSGMGGDVGVDKAGRGMVTASSIAVDATASLLGPPRLVGNHDVTTDGSRWRVDGTGRMCRAETTHQLTVTQGNNEGVCRQGCQSHVSQVSKN